MVSRRKLRTVLTTLGLYVGCALVIGYFGVNAFSGNHGLRAQKDLDQHFAALSEELAGLKKERAEWQHRVKLLKSGEHRSRHARGAGAGRPQLSRPARTDLMLKRP